MSITFLMMRTGFFSSIRITLFIIHDPDKATGFVALPKDLIFVSCIDVNPK